MSISIPQPFKTRIEAPIPTISVDPLTVNGIPDTFHIHVEELPTIHLSIDRIPKIQLGVDPIEIRLTELPSIRGHLPADFCVGLSIMGLELMNLRLCGEAQIITEPYHPNPCELCGPVQRQPADLPGAPGAPSGRGM